MGNVEALAAPSTCSARAGTTYTKFAAKMLFVTAFSLISPWSMIVCLALDLLGCVLLVQGVYLGTKQVYEQVEKE